MVNMNSAVQHPSDETPDNKDSDVQPSSEEDHMKRMGRQQKLLRHLNPLAIFAFSMLVMGTWPTLLT
jgi:hypothetical protein